MPVVLTPEAERTPPYPKSVRAQGIEGTVLLRVYVGTSGRADDVQVARRLGGGCDAIAVKWVKRWRFAPAKAGDEAVGMWVDVPVRFVLD